MIKFGILISLSILLTNCSQRNNHYDESRESVPNPEGNKKDTFISTSADTNKNKPKQMNKYFPFELLNQDGQYLILANLESPEIYPLYYNFFKKHGYEGNGPCWEGHVTQILEKLDSKLLSQIDFDSEAGALIVHANNKESQIKFVEILTPIFSDLNKLEEWVKKADRSRVDD